MNTEKIFVLVFILVIVLCASALNFQATSIPHKKYLDEYGSIHSHMTMLKDEQRMRAYYDAIQLNSESHFADKVVLDVGAGTGVLSIWAAKAGAKKVYAVEASDICVYTKKVVVENGLSDVITVLNQPVEKIKLTEKVDVVISEWMGNFLLTESMVQSVIFARDRWLKPDGVMYPSSVRLYISSVDKSNVHDVYARSLHDSMTEWDDIQSNLFSKFGLKFTTLKHDYNDEAIKLQFYKLRQMDLSNVKIGVPVALIDVDMHTAKLSDFLNWSKDVVLQSSDGSSINTLCGWFDVSFRVSSHNKHKNAPVILTTSPHFPLTHWEQTVIVLGSSFLSGATMNISLGQKKEFHHDLEIQFKYVDVNNETQHLIYELTALE